MNEQTYISLAEKLRQTAVAEARRYIQDADDVEDVAQEVMLRMWEKHSELLADTKKLHSYAVTLAKNICLDRQKVKRRHPIFRLLWRNDDDGYDEAQIPSIVTPQHQLEAQEMAEAYRNALNRLPYNWQRILTMRGEEEMSYEEIASILGTTESSVRGTLCKAKKKILEYLK